MQYFITGCTGFIGSHIAQKIIDSGGKIKALKRENSDLSSLGSLAEQIEWTDVNIMDPNNLQEAMQGTDIVIHAAATVSFNPAQKENMFKTNVQGTANIVNASLELGIKKFCHISSIAAIGSSEHTLELDETNKWVNDDLTSPYSESKYLAEQEVWRGIAEGLEAVIVNPSVVLGVGDWQRSSVKVFNYITENPPYYPSGLLNYVDVRDVSEIVLKLIQSNTTGERFILNAEAIPYRKAFSIMAKHLGAKAPNKKLPLLLAKVLVKIEAFRAWMANKEPKITDDLIRSTAKKYYYSNQRIKHKFGYEFRKLEDTMQWVGKHYNNT
ncbi:NAD-dependent epimerase/dehydratase family protein [Limibacter armeniacum]|uniref:NAD-dependent epimerase/dehydratase family protein n=1 Tax=Limibacter armeniacum TaxID=466084 RepID=UPI002FE501F4